MALGFVAIVLLVLLGAVVLVLLPRRPVLGMVVVVGLVLLLAAAFLVTEIDQEREEALRHEGAARATVQVERGAPIPGVPAIVRRGDYQVTLPPLPEELPAQVSDVLAAAPTLRDDLAEFDIAFAFEWEPDEWGDARGTTARTPTDADATELADEYVTRLLAVWLRQVRQRAPASLARVQSLLRKAPPDAPEQVARYVMAHANSATRSVLCSPGERGRFRTECETHILIPFDELTLILKDVNSSGRVGVRISSSRRRNSILAGIAGIGLVAAAAVVLKVNARRGRERGA